MAAVGHRGRTSTVHTSHRGHLPSTEVRRDVGRTALVRARRVLGVVQRKISNLQAVCHVCGIGRKKNVAVAESRVRLRVLKCGQVVLG